ncbi:MAG: hypothetical protein KA171_04590, partial [Reyranella sp.]|nr:hypothetical protein [Reyranella sp.]
FRHVCTRFDRIALNYLAMAKLAAVRLWLRHYESAAQYSSEHIEVSGGGHRRLAIAIQSAAFMRLVISRVCCGKLPIYGCWEDYDTVGRAVLAPKRCVAKPGTVKLRCDYSSVVHFGSTGVVGIRCKSCGHRALATPDPPKMDHEIITQLSQSTITCSKCNGSTFDLVRFPSSAADTWLKGSPL